MYVVSNSTTHSKWNEPGQLSPQLWPPQILLFVAPVGSIAGSLKYAIEREFPKALVRQVPNLAAACVAFEHPVRLILVDTMFTSEIEAHSCALSRQHPEAAMALIHSGGTCTMREILALKAVHGVLPMNVKLDIWLSVVRLLLHGGEYFPSAMFQPFFDDRAATDTQKVDAFDDLGPEETVHLTEREGQILELVARGLQNKLIAAELHLSVHTVKVHLHNLIRKLGVRNRTELAAAFYRRRASYQASATAPATT
jgi:DNA-binding NarL/FixJ family response regulator